ncbi:hypothetical protein Y1Q_0005760 [Alligator mississippiensis]|uniref:Uncharacterized protein n=1 Tax=Alligator mississippiensis TaxID=8496 RepID=A0A151MFT0_ALLMI|nr:hypothetical protein Y1Q_0005760 [Alligator mississippiensis]
MKLLLYGNGRALLGTDSLLVKIKGRQIQPSPWRSSRDVNGVTPNSDPIRKVIGPDPQLEKPAVALQEHPR